MAIDRDQLVSILADTSARWKAAPEGEIKQHSLGYVPDISEHSLQTREMIAHLNVQHLMTMSAGGGPALYPPVYDWRAVASHGGLPAGDYVTPIRDQGQCGSCVSFGSVAALESAVLIDRKTPGKDDDLSEAFLFFCHHGLTGGTCAGGWNTSAALTSLQGTGTVTESCFPYTDHQQACTPCADWQKQLTKIKAWHPITAAAAMKAWIAGNGPVVTCFSVYEDFDYYSSGVYHHVSGALRGGHCVCVVGYNDTLRAWICKNSWGTGWGQGGFFLIAYGQCGIDSTMWAIQL